MQQSNSVFARADLRESGRVQPEDPDVLEEAFEVSSQEGVA
jgi:hypothetical protein